MDELILRYLAGETSASEEAWLRRWRAASVENETRFAELERIWHATAKAEPPIRIPPAPAAAEVLQAAALYDAPNGSTSIWWRVAATAVAAAAMLGLVILFPELRSYFDDHGDYGTAQVQTEVSDNGTLTLSDGSVVRLGPETTLRFRERPRERSVWLDGRAYFAVESDPSHPFTVWTPYGEATALGTRFEVNVLPGESRVLVVEGRVQVRQGAAHVDLEAGEMARASATSSLSVVRVPDVESHLEWLGDFLIFQATPLWRALREIERRYDVTITVVDTPLASRTITALFLDEGFQDVMDVVCRVVEASCTVDAQSATVRLR